MQEREIAYRAALAFCFNPASTMTLLLGITDLMCLGVFMSAYYTTSPFALLSFLGLSALYRVDRNAEKKMVLNWEVPGLSPRSSMGMLWFFLATMTRSNGMVLCFNFPYIAAVKLLHMWEVSVMFGGVCVFEGCKVVLKMMISGVVPVGRL